MIDQLLFKQDSKIDIWCKKPPFALHNVIVASGIDCRFVALEFYSVYASYINFHIMIVATGIDYIIITVKFV